MAAVAPGMKMGPAGAVNDPKALVSSILAGAPPKNPQTQTERLNPDKELLEDVKAACYSLQQSGEKTNDPNIVLVLNAMQGVCNKILLQFDGMSVLQAFRDAAASFPPAVGPAPGASGPQITPNQGPPQAGSPAQAGPQAAPPSGGGSPL